MQHFYFSLDSVFPLVVMMLVGYISRICNVLSETTAKKINTCIYRVFLPILLYFNIMDTPKDTTTDMLALVYAIVSTLAIFILLFIFVPKFVKNRNVIGVVIQAMARSNYALFGIPLVNSMYPNADTSFATMMVIAIVPIFNCFSTLALMTYGKEKPTFLKLAKGIITNPLIVSTVGAYILWLMGFSLPTIVEAPFRAMGDIASPLALFALGASLNLNVVRDNKNLLTYCVLGKIVVVPFIGLGIAVLLGINHVELATLIAVFASPTSVSSYAMTQELGGDAQLAGAQVVFTTIFCVITVFLWIWLFSAIGYL